MLLDNYFGKNSCEIFELPSRKWQHINIDKVPHTCIFLTGKWEVQEHMLNIRQKTWNVDPYPDSQQQHHAELCASLKIPKRHVRWRICCGVLIGKSPIHSTGTCLGSLTCVVGDLIFLGMRIRCLSIFKNLCWEQRKYLDYTCMNAPRQLS